MVYNLARRMLRDPDAARDAAQEAFLNVFRSLPAFRGECSVRTWTYRIALHECIARSDRSRSERRRLEPIDACDAAAGALASPEPLPGDAIDRDARDALVRCAIGQLPGRYRAVVVLRYLEARSYDEIAELLDVPMGTVKTWLFRAKDLLREHLRRAAEEIGT